MPEFGDNLIQINIRAASEELVENAVNKIAVVFPNLHAKSIAKSQNNYFFCNINIYQQIYPPPTIKKKPSRVESVSIEQDSLIYVNRLKEKNNDRV